LTDFNHFLEQLFLLTMSSGGIDDNDAVFLFPETFYTLCCYYSRISLCVRSKERNPRFNGILFKLIKGTSTEGVCTDKT
jgi:hypothetical protein